LALNTRKEENITDDVFFFFLLAVFYIGKRIETLLS